MNEAPRVQIREGVLFDERDGREFRCDVYEPPDSTRNGAAVLLLHGGSWQNGDRGQLRGYGILLGREGYLCVASEYRLLPDHGWPTQLHDAKAALRWMRSSAAELGIDPDRIVVEGNSAGGHLALLVAGTAGMEELAGPAYPGVRDDVAAVIAVYPPTVLAVPRATSTTEGGSLMMASFGEGDTGQRNAQLASPISHAGPDFPPTLLIHGTADTIVPHRSSVIMFDALTAHGVPVDLHLIAGQPHAFDAQPAFGRLCAAEMLLFLKRYASGTTAAAEPAG
ncbi:MAG TPA: alpha/beta hydrolase [Acidimicrobiales bacterium]|nr:alpha/beta hydrolase [Acidimicrobiales bacterium]